MRLRPPSIKLPSVKAALGRVPWKIVRARVVGVAGLFAAGGLLSGSIPGKTGAAVTLAATAYVMCSPDVRKRSNLVRPSTPGLPSVLGAALDTLTGGANGVFSRAVVSLLANPEVQAQVRAQITGMFPQGQLAQVPPAVAATFGPAGLSPAGPPPENAPAEGRADGERPDAPAGLDALAPADGADAPLAGLTQTALLHVLGKGQLGTGEAAPAAPAQDGPPPAADAEDDHSHDLARMEDEGAPAA